MALIQLITTLTPNVVRTTDDLFDITYNSIEKTEDVFYAIEDIDNAVPVPLESSPNVFFKTPFGDAHFSQLSSGVKTILLILHRLQHPELKWVVNWDSAGPNAKMWIIEYLHDLPTEMVPFPLYCTVLDFIGEYATAPWFVTPDDLTPRSIVSILKG